MNEKTQPLKFQATDKISKT